MYRSLFELLLIYHPAVTLELSEWVERFLKANMSTLDGFWAVDPKFRILLVLFRKKLLENKPDTKICYDQKSLDGTGIKIE